MNVGRTATETVPTLYVWRLANNDFKIGLLHERDTAIHDDDAGTWATAAPLRDPDAMAAVAVAGVSEVSHWTVTQWYREHVVMLYTGIMSLTQSQKTMCISMYTVSQYRYPSQLYTNSSAITDKLHDAGVKWTKPCNFRWPILSWLLLANVYQRAKFNMCS